MTAPRYPKGVAASEFPGKVLKAGIIIAGGLHPAIRTEYFRIGHMGSVNLGDVLATLGAIEMALAASGYTFEKGASMQAALKTYPA